VKNWKLIFSIAFSTLILYNSLRVSITYIYYNIDTDGFIEVFCENKDKPELECNGKCHLKKITKTVNHEKNTPIELIDFKDIILYKQNITSILFNKNIYQNKPTFQYLNLYSFKLLTTYFHPPNA